MSTKKKIFWISGIILTGLAVIVLMIRVIYGGPEDVWVCEVGGWIKHGSPRDPKPETLCGSAQNKVITSSTTSIANPASVFCLDNNGSLAFHADAAGNQYATCVFDDGRECEEWDFYRTKQCEGVGATQEQELEQIPTY